MKDILIKEIKVNDYLTVSKLPGADYVINPYVGCSHACKYCYASFMKRFTGHEEAWGTFLDVKRCDKEVDINKLKNKTVFLSSVTDCYNPLEEKYEITRNILKQLIKADCLVNIATKSKLILRDLNLIKSLKKVIVSVSINTLDENFRTDMDNASSIEERLEVLKKLHKNGIYTVLFMSPMFPYLTDWQALIKKTSEYVSEFWFENLNLRGDYKYSILNYIKAKHFNYYDEYIKIYVKNDKEYWQNLSKEIEIYCQENKIKYQNYFHHEEIVKK